MAGIALLVEIVLAVGVVAYIGYPLLKERLVDDEPEEMPDTVPAPSERPLEEPASA